MRFPLGRMVATPGALDALAATGRRPDEFLDRHAASERADLLAAGADLPT